MGPRVRVKARGPRVRVRIHSRSNPSTSPVHPEIRIPRWEYILSAVRSWVRRIEQEGTECEKDLLKKAMPTLPVGVGADVADLALSWGHVLADAIRRQCPQRRVVPRKSPAPGQVCEALKDTADRLAEDIIRFRERPKLVAAAARDLSSVIRAMKDLHC